MCNWKCVGQMGAGGEIPGWWSKFYEQHEGIGVRGGRPARTVAGIPALAIGIRGQITGPKNHCGASGAVHGIRTCPPANLLFGLGRNFKMRFNPRSSVTKIFPCMWQLALIALNANLGSIWIIRQDHYQVSPKLLLPKVGLSIHHFSPRSHWWSFRTIN